MPIYEFACKVHRFEYVASIGTETMKCEFCNRTARIDHVGSMRRSIPPKYQRAAGFTPIVIHKNAKGQLRFPIHAGLAPPKGYEKVELTTTAAVRKFESQMNESKRAEYVEYKSRERARSLASQSQRRSDLRAAMAHMSPAERDFAQYAMEENDKREVMDRSFDAGFCVEALSYDSSNREQFREGAGFRGRKE